jgi:hypothetical protein
MRAMIGGLLWLIVFGGWIAYMMNRDPNGRVYYEAFIGIVAFIVLWSAFWNWRRKRMTDADRPAEITRLEKQRDALLNAAPRYFLFSRIIVTLMFVLWAVWFSYGFLHGKITPGFLLVGGLFGLITGHTMYRVWINPPAPGDKWGMARLLEGRNGDTIDKLQGKIDRLQAGEDR